MAVNPFKTLPFYSNLVSFLALHALLFIIRALPNRIEVVLQVYNSYNVAILYVCYSNNLRMLRPVSSTPVAVSAPASPHMSLLWPITPTMTCLPRRGHSAV